MEFEVLCLRVNLLYICVCSLLCGLYHTQNCLWIEPTKAHNS